MCPRCMSNLQGKNDRAIRRGTPSFHSERRAVQHYPAVLQGAGQSAFAGRNPADFTGKRWGRKQCRAIVLNCSGQAGHLHRRATEPEDSVFPEAGTTGTIVLHSCTIVEQLSSIARDARGDCYHSERSHREVVFTGDCKQLGQLFYTVPKPTPAEWGARRAWRSPPGAARAATGRHQRLCAELSRRDA
jgi:hypothetical protein